MENYEIETLKVVEDNEKRLMVANYQENFDIIKGQLDGFVNEHLIITNDREFEQVKEFRTKLKKDLEKSKMTRDMAHYQVAMLDEQLLSIEKEIKKADATLKTIVEEYKSKEKSFSIEIKTTDKNKLDMVKSYAEQLGLIVKEK